MPRDQIVLPGLINTHTHAPMVMFRGLADDLALMDWLQKYIFPAEAEDGVARVRAHRHAAGGARDDRVGHDDLRRHVLLRGGDREGDAARPACAACSARRSSSFRSPTRRRRPKGWRARRRSSRRSRTISLIVPAVAPHAMYTLDRATLLASAELGRTYDVPVLIHLAETEDEVEDARETEHKATPAGYLESIGFWGPKTLAAHGVWVTDEDIAILKRRNVGVSHNPESNMKLASGTAPVAKYLAAGVALGLGTDGAASNNDLDMFEAMRQAAFLAKLATRQIRRRCRRRRRSTWRPSAARGRSAWTG